MVQKANFILKILVDKNGKYGISYHNKITYLCSQIKILRLLMGEKLQGKRKLTVNGTMDGIMGTKEGS